MNGKALNGKALNGKALNGKALNGGGACFQAPPWMACLEGLAPGRYSATMSAQARVVNQ